MTPQELKQQAHKEFDEKKQELKDWLHGTVYKGYDLEELSECVQEDVDTFFTTDFIDSLIDRTVQMTEERIVGITTNLQEDGLNVQIEGDYYINFRDLESRITSKRGINK